MDVRKIYWSQQKRLASIPKKLGEHPHWSSRIHVGVPKKITMLFSGPFCGQKKSFPQNFRVVQTCPKLVGCYTFLSTTSEAVLSHGLEVGRDAEGRP